MAPPVVVEIAPVRLAPDVDIGSDKPVERTCRAAEHAIEKPKQRRLSCLVRPDQNEVLAHDDVHIRDGSVIRHLQLCDSHPCSPSSRLGLVADTTRVAQRREGVGQISADNVRT